MTRLQFWILNGCSIVFVLLLGTTIVVSRWAQQSQVHMLQAQQYITEGENCDYRVHALATRVYQLEQSSSDTGLHDLLVRQQITVTPPAPTGGLTGGPAAPASTASPTETPAKP